MTVKPSTTVVIESNISEECNESSSHSASPEFSSSMEGKISDFYIITSFSAYRDTEDLVTRVESTRIAASLIQPIICLGENL